MPAPHRFQLAALLLTAVAITSPTFGDPKSTPVPSNTGRKAPAKTPAPADGTNSGSPQTKPTPIGAAGGIQLSEEAFHLDSVGLSMHLPGGTRSESVRIGDRTSVQISPEDAKWIINIQTPQTTNEKTTIVEVADRTIEALQASVGVLEATKGDVRFADTLAKVIDRVDDLHLPGGTASRFYVSVPSDNDPRGKSRLVKGYTIFKSSIKQFVIFELIAGELDFSKARVAYETSVGTASFEYSEGIAVARKAAIAAGLALFEQMGDQDYLAAMGPEGKETWYRLYMPAANGAAKDATELGYRGVKFWKGQRGEVDPKKSRANWNESEQQQGFLSQDRSRVLVNGMIADSMTICFMTPDRSEEVWSSTTSVKDSTGKSLATVNEIGSRLKDDLTVVTTESGKPTRTTKPAIGGKGYISQVEKFLLPRVLGRKRVAMEYGFYAWDTLSRTVSFRRDVVEPQRTGARDAKVWNITTTIRDDTKHQTSTVSDAGEMIGATLDDGRTWEIIEFSALKNLWQQKGLPTDH